SPKLLDNTLRLKARPDIRFAGQITGCEGYVESAAVGIMAARFAASEILGAPIETPPETTALGAILSHITGGADAKTFQPMNVNFGLFPPIDVAREELKGLKGKEKGRYKKKKMSQRALNHLSSWINEHQNTKAA
ncbi:MAG: FAD-dependent oxidoreductase, partial [Pseudomonadota bacterium]